MVSFQTKKSQFGYILEDLGMENVIYFGQWNILRPLSTLSLGTFYGHLVIL
jgi:hypothetical protein